MALLQSQTFDYKTVAGWSTGDALATLESRREGLSLDEVTARQITFGANTLETHTTTWWEIFLRQFKSAFIYLLLAASVVSLIEEAYIDAGMIFFFLFLNAFLGFWQEMRAEKALSLLKTFVDRKTRVRRGGVESLISVTDIVPGDIVILDAGDMLPGDGIFVRAEEVTVDESPLTGEIEPIKKYARAMSTPPERYDLAENIAFTRTTLLSGDAEVLITAIGTKTVIGDIAKHLDETVSPSAFEEGISQFSRFILKLVLATIPIIFILNYFVHGADFNSAHFLLFAIALTVSVIPEALPLVMTISLSRGALELAKKQVVPRRLSAIEDLGSIDVLCSDKTGTITENRLAVSGVWGNEEHVLSLAVLPPLSSPVATSAQNSVFDHALLARVSDTVRTSLSSTVRIDELPFDPIRRRDSVLVKSTDGAHLLVMRGAPEMVYQASGTEASREAHDWIASEGKKGCRVLAIAQKVMEHDVTEVTEARETGVEVVGLVSFADPLKASTKEAVQSAKALGVQVKIITGDAREVAGWVGVEAGILTHESEVLTGDELMKMTEAEQLDAVDRYHVFARTMPLQKTHIITMLQKRHLVGFLGEGFNDAPALKAAHVGLAVANASDIAQDASDVVLLNPSLVVIVDGIREGRRIFANSMKYLRTTLASNFGNFYALAFSSLFIPYLPMLPIQVLLLNLLSDFPMMAIATDNVDDAELERPRGYQVTELTSIALVLGVVSTMFDFAFFGYFQQFGESVLQTMWFAGSIVTELVIIFSIRTTLPFWRARRPSFTLVFLSGIAILTTVSMLHIPWVQEVFRFVEPTLAYVIPAGILIAMYFVTTEVVKILFYRWWRSAPTRHAGLG
jgi:P-type Mg2+ transporter